MTNKSMGTKERAHEPEGLPLDQETLRMAYEIHTLAQILYGHLAVKYRWPGVPLGMGVYEPLPSWSAPPAAPFWAGMWGAPMGQGPMGPPPPWLNPLVGP